MPFEYSKPYRPIALSLSKTDNILQPNIPRHIKTKKPFGKAPSLKPMLPPEITLTYCLLPERKSSKLHKIIKILSLAYSSAGKSGFTFTRPDSSYTKSR